MSRFNNRKALVSLNKLMQMCLNKNIISGKTIINILVRHIPIHISMHHFPLYECTFFYNPEKTFHFVKITSSEACKFAKENKE